MNTILFILAGAVLVMVVLAKIPGLEHLVRPIVDLLFTGLKVVIENVVSWFIWLFKVLWSSHLEVAQHLVFSAEAIDPSIEMRKRAE